jgi:hypothetical protein
MSYLRKEEEESSRDRQGIRREYCLDDLLETLLEGPLGFNGILRKINEEKYTGAIVEPHYCKATVRSYLNKAIERNLAKYMNPKASGVGDCYRRPVCLTAKGRARALKNRVTNAITILSEEDFKGFVLNYKLYVVREIIGYYDDLSSGSGGPVSGTNFEDDAEIEKQVNLIEADLRYHSFKEDEITRMWLIDRGTPVLEVIKKLGAPNFFGHYNPKDPKPEYTLQEQELIKQIKEKLRPFIDTD